MRCCSGLVSGLVVLLRARGRRRVRSPGRPPERRRARFDQQPGPTAGFTQQSKSQCEVHWVAEPFEEVHSVLQVAGT